MPNWCANSLTLTGDVDKVEEVWNLFTITTSEEGHDIIAEMMTQTLPCPEILHTRTSPPQQLPGESEEELATYLRRAEQLYGAKDWYVWHTGNWGTKWDADATVRRCEPGTKVVTFDTAWSPPQPWVDHLAQKFAGSGVTFTLAFCEMGMGYAGSCTWYTEGEHPNVVEHEYEGEWFVYSDDDDEETDDSAVESAELEQFLSQHNLLHCGG